MKGVVGSSQMERMGRSSVEAYGAIILALVLAALSWAGVIQNMYVVIASSVGVFALLSDVMWRSPFTIQWATWEKVTCLLVLLGLLAYGDSVLYDHDLASDQDSVFQALSAEAYLPPSKDAYSSSFTVRNGSSQFIAKHNITCRINLIENSNHSRISGIESTLGLDGKSAMLSGGHIDNPPYIDTVIEPGGDATTDYCLSSFGYPAGSQDGADCADVSVVFTYFLKTQPHVKRQKLFRFVARRGGRIGNELIWVRQSNELSRSPCEGYTNGQYQGFR